MNSNNTKSQVSKKLMALSSAAMALPAMTPSTGIAAQPTETTISYRYTQYRETSLDYDEIANDITDVDGSEGTYGSQHRYNIDVHQYGIAGPLGSKYAYSIALQDESLSGASPWYTVQAEDGTVDVVMSGASIEDDRSDINSALTYFYDGGSVTGNVAYSVEDDYESGAFGLSTEREFDNKQTAVSAGFSYSSDVIDPEDSAIRYNTYYTIEPGQEGGKDSYSMFLSVSRVLSPISQVLSGVSYTSKSGYLTDAYKNDDIRPGDKEQFTWNVSYRRFSKKVDAALHFDYRYYSDTWGVASHTLSSSVYKTWNKLQVVPTFRYYLQSEADFYFPYHQFDEDTGGRIQYNYYSNDARLSDYGALSFGLKFIFNIKPVSWVIGGEYYKAAQEIAPSKSDNLENPGLVEFYRFTVGVDHKF